MTGPDPLKLSHEEISNKCIFSMDTAEYLLQWSLSENDYFYIDSINYD